MRNRSNPAPACSEVQQGPAPAPVPSGYLADLLLLDTSESDQYIASSAHFAGESPTETSAELLQQAALPKGNHRGKRRYPKVPKQPLPDGPGQQLPHAQLPDRPRRGLLPTPPGWAAGPQQPPTKQPCQQLPCAQLPGRPRRALLPTPPGWGAAFYRSQEAQQETPQPPLSQPAHSGKQGRTAPPRNRAYKAKPARLTQPTEGILIDLNF